MRILVVGAGAIGGYFGGRLLQSGRDVTFLVRPKRASELAENGLILKSPRGDVTLANPATVLSNTLSQNYDLVLLSCKAYDLEEAVEAFAPAVGPATLILPLLNGMSHLDILDDRFGPAAVLGGQCVIAVTLDAERAVHHLNDAHALSFGERGGETSDRLGQVAEALCDAGFDARQSDSILYDMWEKWIFLASLASINCLMRASIGEILSVPKGEDLIRTLFEECRAIAGSAGYPPRAAFLERTFAMFTAKSSPLTASMLRDLEAGGRIEADHIIGDLLRRRTAIGRAPGVSLLRTAYVHMKTYEARRLAREAMA